jgi:hypothetical protein
MNELLKQIISDRRKWLNEERIEDWNAQDTAFVAKRFAKLKETEIWNAAIDAAAEVARLEVTEIATGEKVITIDASVNGITSVLVSKQSILNLKK